MSFQGDVAGIGLGELLQSLSRSRREGMLVLQSTSGLTCTLGIEAGLLHLLPQPGEDADRWRQFARQAWALEPDDRLDAVRTAEIARANRMERIFQLLDSKGVHFRFDTDPIPDPAQPKPAPPTTSLSLTTEPAKAVDTPRQSVVACEGVPVEFLLLEYARLEDELSEFSAGFEFEDSDVPAPPLAGEHPRVHEGFLEECDGRSNLTEIAHRLAWPIRQARLALAGALSLGALRMYSASELLEQALTELDCARLHRAASRTTAWVNKLHPGELTRGEAEQIQEAWTAGGLFKVLNVLPTGLLRTIVRRMDAVLDDPAERLQRWRDLHGMRRGDSLIELHLLRARTEIGALEEEAAARDNESSEAEDLEETEEQEESSESERVAEKKSGRAKRGEMPSAREFLDFARKLRKGKHSKRALPILRMAARRQPSGATARIELGSGLVEGGAVDEGAPWILETARDLIEGGSPEKAIPALRSLLEFAPGLGEARRMSSRARNLVMRRQIIRKHSVIALAVLAILSVGAWVQIHMERTMETKLGKVATLLGDPIEAQEQFDRYFDGDENDRVRDLSRTISMRRRDIELALRADWYATYRSAQRECTFGDPELGLRRALEIKNPPRLTRVREPWPLVSDLYNAVSARFQEEYDALGDVAFDYQEQVAAEKSISERIVVLTAVLGDEPRRDSAGELQVLFASMQEGIAERVSGRENQVEQHEAKSLLDRQEVWLSAARSHVAAGQLPRALNAYDKLLASDPTGRLERILHKEFSQVRERHQAKISACGLAEDGDHETAIEQVMRLEPSERFSLPWRLDTFPPGAIVRLPDGSERPTPLVMESRTEDRFELRITLDGHRERTLRIDGPDDRFVWLTRTPGRSWATEARVDALPVPVGDDHIVCDRAGGIARLTRRGRTRWQTSVPSLGGIERAPVFLTKRPGSMLVITEEGDAWILDSKTGELEGPHSLGSPPMRGPWTTADGAAVRLRDGRVLEWGDRLRPTPASQDTAIEAEAPVVSDGYSLTGALAVLRAPSGSRRQLDSPWNDQSVEILDEVYRVRSMPESDGDPHGGGGLAAERSGNWSFLAWEAPNARLPLGRLWISDDAGLRSFEP